MKKLFATTLFLFIFIFSVKAQSKGDFFGGASLAYAKPTGDFSNFANGGLSYRTMVGVYLSEKLGVGLEYGGAITASLDNSGSSGIFGLELYGLSSYLAKTMVSFFHRNFSPLCWYWSWSRSCSRTRCYY